MNREHDRLLRLPDVIARTGLSRTTIYRKAADGSFPHATQISVRVVAWYESEIAAWVAAPMEWKRAA